MEKKLLNSATKDRSKHSKNSFKKRSLQNSWSNRKIDTKQIAEKTVKPKPVPEPNWRNVEEIVIPPEKKETYWAN